MVNLHIACDENSCIFNYTGNCQNRHIVKSVFDEGLSYTEMDPTSCDQKMRIQMCINSTKEGGVKHGTGY